MKLCCAIARALAPVAGSLVLAVLTSCEKQAVVTSIGPPEVLVSAVIQEEVPIFQQWVGTLDGSENADVKARTTGYLQSRNYQEGSFVKKGDLLFEIDPRPFVAALDQAKGQLDQAQASMIAAQLQAKRAEELFKGKVISDEEYTNETQDYQTKLAAVAAAQAALEQAKLNLDYTKVISPLDGIAGQAQAQIGDLVGTGSNTTLTTVSQLEPVRCYFPISEQSYWRFADELKKMMAVPEEQRPDRVELILPDGTVYSHKGKFAFVNRQVDSKTGTIQVAVNFPNPDLTLRPGQYVTARAQVQTIPNALLIPQAAISELQGGTQIAVISPDGKAEIREIETGPIFGQLIVVTQGVKLGEKVVVEGFQKIRQGMEVSAKPYSGGGNHQGEQNAKVETSSSQS
jgi:membrane fusion protein, multidrug efflux system